jgi:hypothetical protein
MELRNSTRAKTISRVSLNPPNALEVFMFLIRSRSQQLLSDLNSQLPAQAPVKESVAGNTDNRNDKQNLRLGQFSFPYGGTPTNNPFASTPSTTTHLNVNPFHVQASYSLGYSAPYMERATTPFPGYSPYNRYTGNFQSQMRYGQAQQHGGPLRDPRTIHRGATAGPGGSRRALEHL